MRDNPWLDDHTRSRQPSPVWLPVCRWGRAEYANLGANAPNSSALSRGQEEACATLDLAAAPTCSRLRMDAHSAAVAAVQAAAPPT
ncbi:hypothetical protein DFR68_105285 [Nocardia mexicana]|uniref:Uncharacterized protein n=1 Tax=Nocardia mexicana TaxID=279262 RepID=A0A370H4W0_9NOCA|nr:hypothetical protein DFR68_105285 [Nocardia mexicana]